MTQTRITPTTTLLITRPSDYHLLEASYQLLRYELPRDLPFKLAKSELWGKMQNTLQGQIDYPYRVFTHDELDGKDKKKWVVYILIPCGAPYPALTMPICSDALLPYKVISFTDLEFHLLVKLLHVAHMHGHHAGRFTGQGKCYVHAKKKDKKSHICAEINLYEDIKTKKEETVRQFKVEAHATRFFQFDPKSSTSKYAYFGRRTAANGSVYFLQMKPEEIVQAMKRKEALLA